MRFLHQQLVKFGCKLLRVAACFEQVEHVDVVNENCALSQRELSKSMKACQRLAVRKIRQFVSYFESSAANSIFYLRQNEIPLLSHYVSFRVWVN